MNFELVISLLNRVPKMYKYTVTVDYKLEMSEFLESE